MRKLVYLFLFIPHFVFTQTILGKLMNEELEPISSNFIEIETSKNETLIINTDEEGKFEFDLNKAKSFILSVKEFGFLPFEKNYKYDSIQQLEIVLKKDTTVNLETVSISAQKPMLKRKVDGLEFTVENTPLQNLSAWDILKNTPTVLMKNDQLSIRGNSQIIVMINDKKTLMTQDQLKQLLENTNGDLISSIEVITNPPAKYEASGSAIINIKMKKNTLSGYKGQLYTRYHQSIYSKGMIGTSHTYNKNKWQLTGSYYFVNGKYIRKNLDVVTYENEQTKWESDMIRRTVAKEQHIYNFATQYSIDGLQNIQFGFNGYNNPESAGNYIVPTTIYNLINNNPESNYITQNNRKEYSNSFNSYFIYDKKFNKNSLTWTNNFSIRHYKENQGVLTQLDFKDKPYNENEFKTNSGQNVKLYSTQFDYTLSDDNYGIEAGTKYSYVTNDNDMNFYERVNQNLIYQPEKSNTFDYKEQILAFYVSGNYKWKKWEVKTGLRSETTWINTISDNPENKNNRINSNLFPTFYLNHTINDKQQLGFNYGKRISRPNYNFLNPSKSYYNLFSYFQGDANLKSTFIDNFSLNYTVSDWNFETYYRYEKDPAMEISYQDNSNNIVIYNFTNIKNGKAFGGNISKNFNLKSWLKFNFFMMGEYNQNYYFGKNVANENQLYKNDVFFYNTNISTQIDFNKQKTFNLFIGYQYNSKSIQGSFDISSSQNTYLIINKKFYDKKFEIGVTFNDIFKTDRNTLSTKYSNQNQYFKDYRDTQYFLINMKYNFGNQKLKETKQGNKTAEQNRI